MRVMYLDCVDTRDLTLGRGPGLLDRDALLPEFGDHGLHDLETFDTFGMTGRRQMLGEDR